ncbi:MAG: hypothetical protein JO264_10175 [Acidisphaera sp.]|nr:hypothetical protein [Acidisphaera sp.]
MVTGLAAEARIAGALWPDVAAGGGTEAGARRAAEQLVESGAEALLSFGLAGGLDPALRPGDLVAPLAVLHQGETLPTDAELRRQLRGTPIDLLLGETRILADAAEKRRVWRQTRAGAVDLESGAVAVVAQRHRLPWAVLRAICDPAERSLPPAAVAALDAGGAIRGWRVLSSVLRQPRQIPALLALGHDAAAARRALLRCVSDAPSPLLPAVRGSN